MSGRLVGTYDLLNRTSGQFAEAQLYNPADEANAVDFEQEWRPAFEQRKAELKDAQNLSLGSLGDNDIQDFHWQWREKIDLSASRLHQESFAVVADGVTQGLMIVTTAGFARESSQSGKPLVLIDLLATAPWNRRKFTATPRFKGVGRIMMVAAISLSVQEEFSGRVGLHALPQAEAWYRDVVGMTDLGTDDSKMRYFEMTEAQARAYLS